MFPADRYSVSPSCHKAAWKPIGRTLFDELQSARRRASSSYHSGLYDHSFTSALTKKKVLVRTLARVIVLCSWTRQFTLTVSVFTHLLSQCLCLLIGINVYVIPVLEIWECLWEGVGTCRRGGGGGGGSDGYLGVKYFPSCCILLHTTQPEVKLQITADKL